MPWDDGGDSLDNALRRVDAFGEFLTKTGIGFWCFHDRDVAPERDTLAATERDLHAVVDRLESMQRATGARLLWGTACLFSHPRYMHGAATSPDVHVFAHAAAQVRVAMEATMRLGGQGYVFWGGREGYTTLLNTDLRREREQLAAFLHLAVGHAKSIGFTGRLYIEPKPHEPSTHQYDSDVEATLNFLREFGLMGEIALNIETNHATLAGHSMEHELRAAIAAGALGSIDANMGTPGLGWDTDRFPTDIALTTQVMLAVLDMGGFTTGGLNFDAKRRRESFTPSDLVIAHLAGMDAFAAGLKVAAAIRADGRLAAFVRDRYASWNGELGRRILSGGVTLADLHRLAHEAPAPQPASGRQEMLEDIVNQVMVRALR
jgi:xylose isomerase